MASANQIAKTLGVSHVAILRAVKTGAIKPASNGQLTLDLVRNSEWYRNRQGKASPKKPEPPMPVDEFANVDKIDLEKKLIAERTEALRLDNEERKKNLLKRDDVEDTITVVVSSAKSRLLLIPAKLGYKLAAMTSAVECTAILDEAIKEALRELSEYKLDDK